MSTDRILTQRDHLTAMVALDTIAPLTTRVRSFLAHGRRITLTKRYTYEDSPPEVTVGLALNAVDVWKQPDAAGFTVRLKPGILVQFGMAAYASDGDVTEQAAWARYHADTDRRRNMTRVDITGGLPDDGPARDDRIAIRAWNQHGVCTETVVAFDPGPDTDMVARHLYVRDWDTDTHDAAHRWDMGNVSELQVADYREAARKLLAAINEPER
ncbi:hypothetical protein BDK92_7205 [Micromonospora pisi]|uniref:Uncharacterized protein n=1 Tax=Micromonospora pisi TaxID=589240 RepID=A0A495JUN7_9ACTN|nr:hypothetical protein [Micromonospora pisi]RKR92727.1 hypothetical protein BDK92_7205 [Micromonospora pisi]